MKRFLLILILLLSILPTTNAGVVPDTLGQSEILIGVTEVNPRDTITVSVLAANTTHQISGADVTLEATNGTFSTNTQTITGITDANGFFNASWTAPLIGFLEPEQIVTFIATIQEGTNSEIVNTTITVKHLNNNAISGTKLTVPTNITSEDVVSISAQVLDVGGEPSPGMQVTFTEVTLLGSFQSEVQGVSDSNGFYNVTWKAPIVNDSQPLYVEIHALIEASATVSYLATIDFLVTLSGAEDLNIVVIQLPSEIEEKTSSELIFQLFNNGVAVTNGSATLTVDGGTFTGGTQTSTIDINATGYFSETWTAPDVQLNQSISLSVEVQHGISTITQIYSIKVYPVIGSLNVSVSLSGTSIQQDETLTVTVTVLDASSSVAIQGASVSMLLPLGIWEESGTDLIDVTTDQNGVATATFNATNEVLLFEQIVVNISITVSKDEYDPLQTFASFTLIKLPSTYSFTVAQSADEITVGETVTLTLEAFENGNAWINATFELVASAGSFENGDLSTLDKTDVNGKLIIVWDSTGLVVDEPTTISILIDLKNSGLEPQTITITVTPVSESDTSSGLSGGGLSEVLSNPAAAIGGGLSILALLAIVAIIIKKKTG